MTGKNGQKCTSNDDDKKFRAHGVHSKMQSKQTLVQTNV